MKNSEPLPRNSNAPAACASLPFPDGARAEEWVAKERDGLCRRREWCTAPPAEVESRRARVAHTAPPPAGRPAATTTLPAPYSAGGTNDSPIRTPVEFALLSERGSVNEILEEMFDTLAAKLVFVSWLSLEALVSAGVDFESCCLAAALDGRTTLETISRSGSRSRGETISIAVDLFLAGVISIPQDEAEADAILKHGPASSPPFASPR